MKLLLRTRCNGPQSSVQVVNVIYCSTQVISPFTVLCFIFLS